MNGLVYKNLRGPKFCIVALSVVQTIRGCGLWEGSILSIFTEHVQLSISICI